MMFFMAIVRVCTVFIVVRATVVFVGLGCLFLMMMRLTEALLAMEHEEIQAEGIERGKKH